MLLLASDEGLRCGQREEALARELDWPLDTGEGGAGEVPSRGGAGFGRRHAVLGAGIEQEEAGASLVVGWIDGSASGGEVDLVES